MKILENNQCLLVTGASGAYDPAYSGASAKQSQHGSTSSGHSGGVAFNPNHPDVISCNNGIIGGMIAGVWGGVPGLAVGVIGGAFSGGCFTNGNGNGGGSGSSDCSSGSECNW